MSQRITILNRGSSFPGQVHQSTYSYISGWDSGRSSSTRRWSGHCRTGHHCLVRLHLCLLQQMGQDSHAGALSAAVPEGVFPQLNSLDTPEAVSHEHVHLSAAQYDLHWEQGQSHLRRPGDALPPQPNDGEWAAVPVRFRDDVPPSCLPTSSQLFRGRTISPRLALPWA